jgi:hypothetical protein
MSVRSAFANVEADQPLAAGGGDQPHRGCLLRRLDRGVDVELQCARREIDVAIAQVAAERRVGRVADAGLDPFRRSLDHRNADRSRGGIGRVGVDRGVDAREIASAVQAPHELIERVERIGIAPIERAVVAQHLG